MDFNFSMHFPVLDDLTSTNKSCICCGRTFFLSNEVDDYKCDFCIKDILMGVI